MNKLSYDITNMFSLALIGGGVFRIYGTEIVMVVTGGLILALNLVTLFVATRGK